MRTGSIVRSRRGGSARLRDRSTNPKHEIKEVQRQFRRRFLAHQPLPPSVKACVKGGSPYKNAKVHCNQRNLARIDVKEVLPERHERDGDGRATSTSHGSEEGRFLDRRAQQISFFSMTSADKSAAASSSPMRNPVAAMRLTIVRIGFIKTLEQLRDVLAGDDCGLLFQTLLQELHAPRGIRLELPVFHRGSCAGQRRCGGILS